MTPGGGSAVWPSRAGVRASDLAHDPAELLRRLIRFDTTNPPGNERECVLWAKALCDEAGLDTRIVAMTTRGPISARAVAGRGAVPPLLLQGHLDVVTTAGQSRAHEPFSGDLARGEVLGRGALDMNGGVAMMLGATMRRAESGELPPGDVLLCLPADEEDRGVFGARLVVEEHRELFAGVKHALDEFGAFRGEVAGLATYPIQIAEKQLCSTRVTIRGPGGHGPVPMRGGAMARLGRLLASGGGAYGP